MALLFRHATPVIPRAHGSQRSQRHIAGHKTDRSVADCNIHAVGMGGIQRDVAAKVWANAQFAISPDRPAILLVDLVADRR